MIDFSKALDRLDLLDASPSMEVAQAIYNAPTKADAENVFKTLRPSESGTFHHDEYHERMR